MVHNCGSPTPRACASPRFTDTEPGLLPGQAAGLELRHRHHARVEDRIRDLKAAGLRNLSSHGFWPNAAWLEIVLAAADLVTWY